MMVPILDCGSKEEVDKVLSILTGLHIKCHASDLTIYTTSKEQFAVTKLFTKHLTDALLRLTDEELREYYEYYCTGTVTLAELMCLLDGRDSDVITINGVPLQIENVRLTVGKIDLRTKPVRADYYEV